MKILHLITLFNQYSDECHPLSMQEILTYLEEFDIVAERKSIYDDIQCLQAWGLDIIFVKTPKQGYFLSNKLLDSIEAKILVDTIYATEFLTTKKSKQLSDKLLKTISIYDANQINNQKNTSIKKFTNEHIYYVIHSIQQAIQANQGISFKYFDITFNKQKKYRKNASLYTLLPISLFYDNQRYYCIGYSSKYNNFNHYRVDKMEDISLISYDCPKTKFDLQKYVSLNFKMTLGDVENITLQFNRSLLNVVFDEFGQDVMIEKIDDNYFTINLSTTCSPTFIGWILQFGKQVKVIKPQSLIDQVQNLIMDVSTLYNKF